jgi:malonate-semialdehyde dehydrogenase (acetylating) / methylmalonate-semialdehyde dehydrogenase
MFHSRIPTRAVCVRSYATVPVQPPLRGLNSVVREKAEKLSRDWKGTNSSGENTKNFIGGEFVQSRSTQWIDVVDPVRRVYHSSFILTQDPVVTVHTNTPHPCSGNNQ